MMKKWLLIICMFMGMAIYASADETPVELDVTGIDPTVDTDLPRSPINPPHASIDDHTFYVNSSHADFVVYLVDENEQVVYCTFMPFNVSFINLPTYLVGTYRIELLTGNWLFYGYITL